MIYYICYAVSKFFSEQHVKPNDAVYQPSKAFLHMRVPIILQCSVMILLLSLHFLQLFTFKLCCSLHRPVQIFSILKPARCQKYGVTPILLLESMTLCQLFTCCLGTMPRMLRYIARSLENVAVF